MKRLLWSGVVCLFVAAAMTLCGGQDGSANAGNPKSNLSGRGDWRGSISRVLTEKSTAQTRPGCLCSPAMATCRCR